MTKFKLFADPEKEEKWLDDMSENGYILRSVNPSFGIYRFDINPDKQFKPKARVDFRCLKAGDKEEYLEIFKQSGWENIYSSSFTDQHYFVQSETIASDEIFSDTASRADRYSRIGIYTLAVGILVAVSNLLTMLLPGAFDYIWMVFLKCGITGIGVLLLAYGIFYIYKSNNIRNEQAGITETHKPKKKLTPIIHKILIIFGFSVMCGALAAVIGFVAGYISGFNSV